jgi:hypothetical protein
MSELLGGGSEFLYKYSNKVWAVGLFYDFAGR